MWQAIKCYFGHHVIVHATKCNFEICYLTHECKHCDYKEKLGNYSVVEKAMSKELKKINYMVDGKEVNQQEFMDYVYKLTEERDRYKDALEYITNMAVLPASMNGHCKVMQNKAQRALNDVRGS